jgi:hypothetical protein
MFTKNEKAIIEREINMNKDVEISGVVDLGHYKDSKESITSEDLKSGYKADSGKTKYNLVPPLFEKKFAELWTMGAKKYSDWNWYLGMPYSMVYNALRRHLGAWWGDNEQYDPVDGQHHLISVAWCACVLFIYDTVDKFKKFDDRIHTLTDEKIQVNTKAKS